MLLREQVEVLNVEVGVVDVEVGLVEVEEVRQLQALEILWFRGVSGAMRGIEGVRGQVLTVGPQVAKLPGMAFVEVAKNWEQYEETEVVWYPATAR